MKYTTLQIIAMMADWRSWKIIPHPFWGISNGKIHLYSSGMLAFSTDPRNPNPQWSAGFIDYLITRPFWFYLLHKVKA